MAGRAEPGAARAQRWARRAALVPAITYPEQLPVAARRADLLAAIRDHPVVVVAGETGSGKTTQLPKVCLELGRGVRGMIGHTQPRRIAARAVAERLAEELGVPLGGVVGYQVRFTDRVGPDTLVKVMTDGILLTEIRRDPLLRRYDTLIVDEAHERSLTIDFLLGYLTRILPRRPDLSVVITSATIDPQRFAAHFGGAPVLEVSGRTYPVEVRYRPLTEPPARDEDDDSAPPVTRDQTEGIVDAIAELAADPPGDVLVFLSGEREIRDTAEVLRGLALARTEVLPLYGRLSAAEQHRVFTSHPGRRIVLATNVAETSLTVPGIRYVVDPGTARISRYSHRLKVQRLPIEPISQASARQRAGRCGRLADGVCIRLYTQADHDGRPAFTEPEILRTNLAAVVLRMIDLRLGPVEEFPFLDPPDRRQVAAGVQLLTELGALQQAQQEPDRRLTPAGRAMARLPVDPRLARMLVAAERLGCLREVLVIVAALSVQDPRERPEEQRGAADAAHARFTDPTSDFLTYLALWRYLHEQRQARSGNAFRRMCREEFLTYLRVREWQDLHGQLRQLVRELGWTVNDTDSGPDRVHQALLAGLLSHVGLRVADGTDYTGARGVRFAIWPGSALARARPQWVMAAELVDTSRLWGRVVARVQPEWVEAAAGHLVQRTYSEPEWDPERGEVVARERVTLLGLPLVVGRRVSYGRIDPVASRALFLRHALVQGEWRSQHAFVAANARLRDEAEEVERRARRRGLVADDDAVLAFFDARVPAQVVSTRHFDRWWQRAQPADPDLLTLPADLLLPPAGSAPAEDFPDHWVLGEHRLRLAYRFEPGAADDGVAVRVPLALLAGLDPGTFDWQVPGRREPLVVELIRSLPKALRRSFVPAPTFAAAVLERVGPDDGPLPDAVARALRALGGPHVAPSDLDLTRVPAHLRVLVRVVDRRGRVLAEGRDLAELQHRLAPQVRTDLSAAAAEWERSGLRDWTVGALPDQVVVGRGAARRVGYPALVDEGDAAAVRVLPTAAEADRAHRAGVRRLLLLALPAPGRAVVAGLDARSRLALGAAPTGDLPAVLDDALAAAVDSLVTEHGPLPRDAAGFGALRAAVAPRLTQRSGEVVGTVAAVLGLAHEVQVAVAQWHRPALAPAAADMRAQVAGLVGPGFAVAVGWPRLRDLVRYLRAVQQRLADAPGAPARDQERMAQVHALAAEYAAVRAGLPEPRRTDPDVLEVRWLLEELRVSLFAQRLGTRVPVSDKRIRRALLACQQAAGVSGLRGSAPSDC